MADGSALWKCLHCGCIFTADTFRIVLSGPAKAMNLRGGRNCCPWCHAEKVWSDPTDGTQRRRWQPLCKVCMEREATISWEFYSDICQECNLLPVELRRSKMFARRVEYGS